MAYKRGRATSRGFTLIEVLVATAITLILMGSVAAMFGFVSTSVSESRAMAETTERLRSARNLLQHDLQGVTARGTPPLRPDQALGYLEYIEGPVGPLWRPGNGYPGVGNLASNTIGTYTSPWDDADDILMFTTRSTGEPYVGRFYDSSGHWNTISSPVAEVCWFVRGTTLFRRVLLVLPNTDSSLLGSWATPYYYSDISMHQEGGTLDPHLQSSPLQKKPVPGLYANSLSDLTKREYRYGHMPTAWPYDARFWNWPGQAPSSSASTGSSSTASGVATIQTNAYGIPNVLGLPTLQESCSSNWPFPYYGPNVPNVNRTSAQINYIPTLFGTYVIPGGTRLSQHGNPILYPYYLEVYNVSANPDPTILTLADNGLNRTTQTSGTGLFNSHYSANPPRFDDVVLSGVVGFDVKIWDPGAPIFQVVGTTTGGTATAGAPGTIPASVAPGDPWYATALSNFSGSSSPTNFTATLGSVGAYVDLNYMLTPLGNTVTGTLTNWWTNYVNGLNNYESNTLVRATPNPAVPGISPNYPGFIIPRPRFATEGDPSISITSGGAYPSYAYMGCPFIMRGIIGAGSGQPAVRMTPNYSGNLASVFDTWSTHYESDGINQDGDQLVDEGTDGIDNPYVFTGATIGGGPWTNTQTGTAFIAGVDDPSELEAPPPYATACRGLQIRIRVIEPGSRQIREVTVIQQFTED